MELSIVVPVYKEEGNIQPFLSRIKAVLKDLPQDYEIIFAMDPSPDATERIILTERSQDERIKLLKFSRRFGQPMATVAGLQYSTGKAVVVIDVDLQDPPELVAEMYTKWKMGFDVVYAQRLNREGETIIKKVVSYVGYKFINKISEVNIPANTGDYRLLSRKAVNEIIKLKESHGFLRGLVALVGFSSTAVTFHRPPRHSGVGNYNRFWGSLKIGFNGIFCFSSYMLSLSTKMGFSIAVFSFLLAAFYLIGRIYGIPFPLGNPTIVILVLFLGGVQLISVGILGEYIARIYDEVRCRPKFIVDRSEGFHERTNSN